MNIQIFGTKKCKDTQKALRFFKERGIGPQYVDLFEKSFSKGEINNIIKSVTMDELIDKESNEYKKKGLEYMEYDPVETIMENPLIVMTPVVRNANRATVGNSPDVWKDWIKEEKGK